ncbi:MAG: hypothetical protein V4558_03945 [Gemmatimonadota bacterium]
MPTKIHRAIRRTACGTIGVALLAITVGAQDQRNEQFYFPGSFNWQFLSTYPEAARLFNAFDYGHAVLYEKLLTKPGNLHSELEGRQFDFLTKDLLIRPPRFAIVEEAVEPTYSKLVWQAKQMFDWAHLLHRQIYDAYSDERLSPAERDVLIERLTDYYLTRSDYAFRPVPKSMALMDEQYYSQVFRKGYPKFNGLIWSYHWLQVGLYEPLIIGATRAERKAGVQATLARFWSMLKDAPVNLPKTMPMASAIAPRFSAAHPRAAVIFDNLHMMHDIISDILAADVVPRADKRKVIYEALAEFRDTTRNVMTMKEWHEMGSMMGGVGAMGGPATGLLLRPSSSEPVEGMAGMQHGAASSRDSSMRGMPGMATPPPPQIRPVSRDSTPAAPSMPGMTMPNVDAARRQLLEAMLRDPVISRRLQSDAMLRRLRAALPAPTTPPSVTPRQSAVPKPRVRPDTTVTKPIPPMPGMKHP